MNDTKRVYCLYRVSTKGQVEKDDIPMQRQCCREFIEAQGWCLERELMEKGVSGFKKSAKERDAIVEIQQAAYMKKFEVLLVFMFDRLGRREDETPFVVEWFVKNGIEVWSVKEGQQRFDTHTDKLMNYIRYWQASGESIKTSIRTKTRLEQIVLEGRFRGGKPPYGYRLEKQGRMNKKNHEVNEILVDDAEAAIVRCIFQKYVNEGYGAQRISRHLLEQGIVNRKGINFTNTTIIKMLKNVMYLGVLRSGNSHSEIFPHLQIIDNEMFQRAQEIMQQRTMQHSEVPLNGKSRALLVGKVYCGHCGTKLNLTTSGKEYVRADGTYAQKMRLRYQCHYKVRHPQRCDGQSGYGVIKLDGIVEDTIKALFEQVKAIPEETMLKRQAGEFLKENEAALSNAQKKYRQYEKAYRDYKAEVLKAIRGESRFNLDLLNELIAETQEKLISWADMFGHCNLDEKRMILSQLIGKIRVWADYRMEIEFNVRIEQILSSYKEAPVFPKKSA